MPGCCREKRSITAALAHPGILHDLERVSAAIDKDPRSAELYVERAYYYRLNARNRVWLARRNLPAVLIPLYVGSWTGIQLLRWFRKSADQGFASAQFNLAILNHEGVGVPKDLAERIQKELAARNEKIDWEAVTQLTRDPRGIPVSISGGPDSLTQIISGATLVQNKVAPGATWDGVSDLPVDEATFKELMSDREPATESAATTPAPKPVTN